MIHLPLLALLLALPSAVVAGTDCRAPAAACGADGDGSLALIDGGDLAAVAGAVPPAGARWQVIPNLGRTLSAVTAWPATGEPLVPGGDSARLEYPVVMDADGEVDVRVLVSPTLDIRHRGGLRYAVSIGDEPPRLVNVRLDPTPGDRDFTACEAP